FSIPVAAWALSNGLVHTYASTSAGIMWARSTFVCAATIPMTFFLFVSTFPTPRPTPPRAVSRVLLLSGVAFTVVSMTPLIARSTSSPGGILQVAYGPLHPLFGVYFISGLAYSFRLLYLKLKILTGIERLQVHYVFLGLSLSILGGTITNLVIPLASGSS